MRAATAVRKTSVVAPAAWLDLVDAVLGVQVPPFKNGPRLWREEVLTDARMTARPCPDPVDRFTSGPALSDHIHYIAGHAAIHDRARLR